MLLIFNYAVEIGARLAYLGHYKRLKDPNILKIADDEFEHKNEIEQILIYFNKKPSKIFNIFFTIIGTIIYYLCSISPKILLDFIAMSMEMFAIINYNQLAKLYPEFSANFYLISKTEESHKLYFKITN